jgi:endonuclease III
MPDVGVHALLLRLPRAIQMPRGRLEAGYYVCVGRALAGDALLAGGFVLDVQTRLTRRAEDECRLASEIAGWPGARPIAGFGCSDCRCATHLHHFKKRPRTSLSAARVLGSIDEIMARLHAAHADTLPAARDPFETLVACILSLRTQGAVTDVAASRLFARWRTPQDLASARPEAIARLIYPVGMYRAKGKTLVAIAREIVAHHDGRTPSDLDALTALPGVGRKTANLVRSFAFRLPAICVDTHVHRITNRWGLVRAASPDETELELRRVLPERHWIELNPLLVRHGQTTCQPRAPHCERCSLVGLCAFDDVRRDRDFLPCFLDV